MRNEKHKSKKKRMTEKKINKQNKNKKKDIRNI